MGSSPDWTQLRTESVSYISVKIYLRKLTKTEMKRKKKDQKTQDRITKNLGIKDVICNVNSRRRRKRERSRRNI